jgi:hypothetical protein
MALKSGSPTNFRMTTATVKRHPRRAKHEIAKGVGDNYSDRNRFATQADRKSTGTSFVEKLCKLRDRVFGPKLPTVHQFKANAKYVGGAQMVPEYLKSLEQGSHYAKLETSTDEDLVDFCDSV